MQIQTGSPSSISAAESCAWSSCLQQRKAADRIFATGIPMLAGVGCSGSYGAGMARELAGRGIPCYEIVTPRPQTHLQQGRCRRCTQGCAAGALCGTREPRVVIHLLCRVGHSQHHVQVRFAGGVRRLQRRGNRKGGNPKCMRSKATFAVLCGASPLKASRGASATGSTTEGTGARTGCCT